MPSLAAKARPPRRPHGALAALAVAAVLLAGRAARADGPPPPPCFTRHAGDPCELYREPGTCRPTSARNEAFGSRIFCDPDGCLECVVPADPKLDDPATPRAPADAPPVAVKPPPGGRVPVVVSAVVAASVLAFALVRRRRRS